MKKLIMSVVAIATLSVTGANANELQEFLELNKSEICGSRYQHGNTGNLLMNKSNFPEKYKIIIANSYKKDYQEELRKASGSERASLIRANEGLTQTFVDEKTGITYSAHPYDPIGGIIQVYSLSRGEISFDLLKQLGGTGMTTKLGWAQFIRNYIDFNIYISGLSAQAHAAYYSKPEIIDQYNQLALYLNSIYVEDLRDSVKQKVKNLNSEEVTKLTSILFYIKGTGMGIDEFLEFLNNHKHNAKLKKLFKDVILYKKNYEEVYEYMRNENERSGIIEDLREIETACASPRNKTIGDVVKSKITKEEIRQEYQNETDRKYQEYQEYQNRVMKNFEKVKHHTKEKVCNPHDYKYKMQEEVFKAEDLEHIGFKSSQMENNMKFLYLELNTYIRENIKKKLKIEDSTIENYIFQDACSSLSETTKTIEDVFNYSNPEFKEFRKQDKDLVCDNNSIDPVKLIMYISKQNGKEKTKDNIYEACDAWFGVSTIDDIINY